VLVSGCRDNQTAADAYINAQSQGAMTWAFIKAANTAAVTLGSMQDLMRGALAQRRYTQVPQISFSTALNATAPLTAFGL
jgi:metacaspase-1